MSWYFGGTLAVLWLDFCLLQPGLLKHVTTNQRFDFLVLSFRMLFACSSKMRKVSPTLWARLWFTRAGTEHSVNELSAARENTASAYRHWLPLTSMSSNRHGSGSTSIELHSPSAMAPLLISGHSTITTGYTGRAGSTSCCSGTSNVL